MARRPQPKSALDYVFDALFLIALLALVMIAGYSVRHFL